MHHPLLAECDNTGGEPLAWMLHCGSAGSNTAAGPHHAGRALTGREKTALRVVPGHAWQAAIDAHGEVRERRAGDACGNSGCAHRACWIEEAHVAELTALLREGPHGDQLAATC